MRQYKQLKKINWQEELIEKYYRSQNGWIDGTTEFHNLCKKYIKSEYIILDLGSGPPNSTSKSLSMNCKELHGIDIDTNVLENQYLSKAFLYDGFQLPFKDNSYDVVCSNYVNEHLENPQQTVAEVYRVLKPGGKYIFRTPNIYHYVSLVSKLTPFFIHKVLSSSLRNKVDSSKKIHKTFYRFNSKKVCYRLLNSSGFDILEFRLIEKEPSYSMNLKVLFYLFMFYERVVNFANLFQNLRANILCVAQKKNIKNSMHSRQKK